MKKWTKGLTLLLTLFLIQGCIKDFQDVDSIEVENWQPEMAVALVNTTVSIADMLDNFDDQGYLNVDDDNFMTLVHQGEIYSTTGDEVVSVPDFTIPMLDSVMVIPYGNLNTPFDIDFFTIKSGLLDYSFQSPYMEDIDVTIKVKNLSNGSESISFQANADYDGSSPVNVSGNMDLTNLIMDFSNDEIEVSYTAINVAGDRVLIPNMILQFHDFEYNFIQGYFAQYEFDLPKDTILINLFENAVSGNIKIEDPQIKLTFNNSFGVPIKMSAQNITAITMSEELMALNSVLDAGVEFNYPSLMEVGEYKVTELTLEKNNSNLSEVLSKSPKEIQFDMTAMANPDANPNIKGFVKSDSQFDISMDVEIPVWLSASDFAINEINDFDASFFDEIENAEFKLIIENGWPVEAGVQVYFLDDNNVVLDSLFDSTNDPLIPAAEVDSDGVVTNSSIGEQVAEVSGNRIENFRNATQIAIEGSVSTAQDGTVAVRFYTDYEMNFKLGLKAKLKE